MKGGEKRKGQRGIAHLWNVMDRESRFLIIPSYRKRAISTVRCYHSLEFTNDDGLSKWKVYVNVCDKHFYDLNMRRDDFKEIE